MSGKKPPGMSRENWMDKLIRDAEARGEFDNLPGAGKPIPGLDKPHDELWWLKRLLKREGLSVTPATLTLRKEIEQALEQVQRQETEEQVQKIVADINEKIAEVNRKATSGPPSNLALLDPDRIVKRWRDR